MSKSQICSEVQSDISLRGRKVGSDQKEDVELETVAPVFSFPTL